MSLFKIGKQKLSTFGLMLILVIGIVLISGYVQEDIPTKLNKTLIQDNMLIGAYYYPWYSEDMHWDEGYTGDPLLGEYNSRDPAVISRHIDWASDYGIDFFLIGWHGPDSWEDETLRNYFLKSPDIKYIKFGIMYETIGRLTEAQNEDVDYKGSIDFNNPKTKQTLINDFKYISKTFFNHPQYLKIDNKPVVYIYLVRDFTGNYKEALQELREELRKEGYELYLLADMVYWSPPVEQKELMQQFDAVTSYNMHTNVPDIDKDFINKVSKQYLEWYKASEELNIDFAPNVMPGYDDTALINPQPTIQRSLEKFRNFIEEARKYLSDKNIILITSWNEWHEGTTIEPDQNYSESYLKVINQTLANYR